MPTIAQLLKQAYTNWDDARQRLYAALDLTDFLDRQ